VAIKEIDEARYNEALEILPPALWLANRFFMGEAADYRRCEVTGKTATTYSAFFAAFGRYCESDPTTVAEFKSFDVNDLPLPK
jgi:hypothetical protein